MTQSSESKSEEKFCKTYNYLFERRILWKKTCWRHVPEVGLHRLTITNSVISSFEYIGRCLSSSQHLSLIQPSSHWAETQLGSATHASRHRCCVSAAWLSLAPSTRELRWTIQSGEQLTLDVDVVELRTASLSSASIQHTNMHPAICNKT